MLMMTLDYLADTESGRINIGLGSC